MNQPEFTLGQSVFVVDCSSHCEVKVPCEICFGKIFVTLILGNGEHQKIMCDSCTHGIGTYPSGMSSVWEVRSAVIESTVDGIKKEGDGWTYRVNHRDLHAFKIFIDKGLAEAEREKQHVEADVARKKMQDEQWLDKKRKLTYSAQYHRAALARLDREGEYHRKMLMMIKEKA
jgi:hypothetical protein